MQYPPRRRVTPNGAETWLSDNGEHFDERLPDLDKRIGYDLINFNLDPQNGKVIDVWLKNDRTL